MEFFPQDFFTRAQSVTVNMVSIDPSGGHDHSNKDENDQSEDRPAREDATLTIQELLDDPQLHSLLQSSEAVRNQVIMALRLPVKLPQNKPNLWDNQTGQICASCYSTIAFSDEDLLLGSRPHNRPLYVSGYAREQRVGRILVDDGSAVNIIPKTTMRELGITIDELSKSQLMIHGFNQGGQRAIGMIRLDLTVGDLASSTLFHVIDARTTYKMLLGRPWIHGNGVIL